jgi:hypothetical protein
MMVSNIRGVTGSVFRTDEEARSSENELLIAAIAYWVTGWRGTEGG